MFSLLVGATDLDLNFRQIGDKGAMAMAQIILTETTLTSVDFGFNDIGREGIHHIAAALHLNSTLLTLNLEVNDIGHKIGLAGAESLGIT